MSRFLKSQNYLMNCLGFVLVIGFISLGAILGCSDDDDGGQDGPQALTENDFATNENLRANLERHTVVHFLEHPESEGHDNDTGGLGTDTVPLIYNRTAEHTYCWEDEDEGAGHFMELDDSEGNEIFRLDVNGECITVLLEAGDYVMTTHHDAQIEKTHSVFIREIDDDNEQAVETKGLINRLKAVASTILKGIKNTVSRDAMAQSVSDNIRILITTNSCHGCDLHGADLTGADLTGADLTGANLIGVIWCYVKRGRFEDNCNGTLTDSMTGLMWEKKTTDGSVHDRDNTHTWSREKPFPPPPVEKDGTAYTDFLWKLNNTCNGAGVHQCSTDADCGFRDNSDGTVTDYRTGLMWEKKVVGEAGNCLAEDRLHSVDATCNWYDATDKWITKLNNRCNNDPRVVCTTNGDKTCEFAEGVGGVCGYAGHRNWRLPEVNRDGGTEELETILDCRYGLLCVDPILGALPIIPPIPNDPTDFFYWSTNSLSGFHEIAWYVNILNNVPRGSTPGIYYTSKLAERGHVRAVRGDRLLGPVGCGLAGHRDWRLPKVDPKGRDFNDPDGEHLSTLPQYGSPLLYAKEFETIAPFDIIFGASPEDAYYWTGSESTCDWTRFVIPNSGAIDSPAGYCDRSRQCPDARPDQCLPLDGLPGQASACCEGCYIDIIRPPDVTWCPGFSAIVMTREGAIYDHFLPNRTEGRWGGEKLIGEKTRLHRTMAVRGP